MDGNITSPSEALREPQVRGSGAGQHAIKEMEYAAGILPHPRLHYSLHVSAPPGGWQAAVRHDTVVSRRRRRHATAASSDFFCVPFGGRASGRVSTPPTPSATTVAWRRRLHLRQTDCADSQARASRLLRPSAPRRATGLPTPIATTAAPARRSARPRADGMWTGPSSHVEETCRNLSV